MVMALIDIQVNKLAMISHESTQSRSFFMIKIRKKVVMGYDIHGK